MDEREARAQERKDYKAYRDADEKVQWWKPEVERRTDAERQRAISRLSFWRQARTRRYGRWRASRRAWQAARKNKDTPQILSAGITTQALFGSLGTLTGWVGHYTAGPTDTSDSHAIQLWRQYHQQHKGQGWGGIGYHVGITRKGNVVRLRPASQKGAHVGGYNTGRIGIVMHGTGSTGMSDAQLRALKHVLANPRRYGLPAKLSKVPGKVHKDYNATSCPGQFEGGYRRAAR